MLLLLNGITVQVFFGKNIDKQHFALNYRFLKFVGEIQQLVRKRS